MRHAHDHRTPDHRGPNMTPLVDVVMVILIFLMLSGGFVGLSRYLTHQPTTAGPALQRSVAVHLERADGEFLARIGRFDCDTPEQLRTRLALMREQDPGTAVVVLHPERDVPYGDILLAYEAATKAKFEKIVFGGD